MLHLHVQALQQHAHAVEDKGDKGRGLYTMSAPDRADTVLKTALLQSHCSVSSLVFVCRGRVTL